MAISTAERTSSGRATISSCAMNDPIDTADDAHGVEVELFDQRGGVGDHLLGAETARLFGRAYPPVVEGDRAVAGPHEFRDLM